MTPASDLARGKPSTVNALAARVGLTEGQAYTAALLLVVAALLASSLTDLTGRFQSMAAPVAGAVPEATSTVPPSVTTEPPPTVIETAPTPLPAPVDAPAASTTVVPPTTVIVPPPFEPLIPDEEEPVPCPAEGLVDGVREASQAIDTLVGGLTPNRTILSVIAIATGCSQQDPGVLLLAALVEIGQSMPDLGLGDLIEIPQLPFIEVPDLLIDLLQPARVALDELCEVLGTVNLLASQVGPHYPPPFDAAFSVSLFYAMATCGQLQNR